MPSPGCTVDDIRWFVIREFGKMKAAIKSNEKIAEKQGIDVDILKGKMKEKFDADQVSVKVINASDKMDDKIANIAAKMEKDLEAFKILHTQAVDDYTKRIEGMVNDIRMDEVATKLKELENNVSVLGSVMQVQGTDDGKNGNYVMGLEEKMAKFEGEIKQAFGNVERVEADFVAHVGQAFSQLSAETLALKQEVSKVLLSGAADTFLFA